MPNFMSRIFLFVLKAVFGFFALLFAVSLIGAAIIVLIWTLLKALLTGKKPASAMVFGRFQRFSVQGTQAMWRGATPSNPKSADVVDVDAREIRDEKRLD